MWCSTSSIHRLWNLTQLTWNVEVVQDTKVTGTVPYKGQCVMVEGADKEVLIAEGYSVWFFVCFQLVHPRYQSILWRDFNKSLDLSEDSSKMATLWATLPRTVVHFKSHTFSLTPSWGCQTDRHCQIVMFCNGHTCVTRVKVTFGSRQKRTASQCQRVGRLSWLPTHSVMTTPYSHSDIIWQPGN